MKNLLKYKLLIVLLIFSLFVINCSNSFAGTVETITYGDKDYPIYYDSSLDNKYAIDVFYSTYITVKKDDIYYLIIVSEPECLRYTDTNRLVNSSGLKLTVRYYVYDADYDVYFPTGEYDGSNSSFTYDELIYTVSNLYRVDGSLYLTATNYDDFFYKPPVVLEEIMLQEMEQKATIQEILGVLPLIIVVVVSFLGLRKALRMLLTLLRQS